MMSLTVGAVPAALSKVIKSMACNSNKARPPLVTSFGIAIVSPS